MLIDIFHEIDFLGNKVVDKAVLAKKITKAAEAKRILDIDVIEIVNINKMIPLNRLIY